ncbi:hypothetical protein ACFLQK_02205, partial [bacterium]
MNSRNTLHVFIIAIALAAMAAARAAAEDCEFSFGAWLPDIYNPPGIVDVDNTQPVTGGDFFTVYAQIEAGDMMETCCQGTCTHECSPLDSSSTCDWSFCGSTDFYLAMDPRISPNPPCIPNSVDSSVGIDPTVCSGQTGNPKIYYYFNGDPAGGGSADMVFDS